MNLDIDSSGGRAPPIGSYDRRNDLVFANIISSSGDDSMLFHITAQHDHLSCGGVDARKSGQNMSEFQRESGRWMEGNDKVKVIAAYLNQPHHRIFAVVEADTYDDLNTFTNRWKDPGSCDVQVVGDGISARHAAANWGK